MNPVTYSQSVVRSSLISFSHLCLHLPVSQSLCHLGFLTKISLSSMCTICASCAIFHGSTVASAAAKITRTVYLIRITNCEAPHYTVFCSILLIFNHRSLGILLSILFLNTVCVMPVILRVLCSLKYHYNQ
jgi:hypothetical protein